MLSPSSTTAPAAAFIADSRSAIDNTDTTPAVRSNHAASQAGAWQYAKNSSVSTVASKKDSETSADLTATQKYTNFEGQIYRSFMP